MSITQSEIKAKLCYDYILNYCINIRYCTDCLFSNYGQKHCVFLGIPEAEWPEHLDIDTDVNNELKNMNTDMLSEEFFKKLP